MFTSTLEPVAERLVFINNHDQLNVKLSADKPVYNKREKVKLVLSVKDPDDEVIRASFSMAVTDQSMTVLNGSYEPSILSEILLASDLRGTIEDPGYYFSADNRKTRTDLDNLLLTQGWRKFLWKDILADRFPALPYSAEKTLAISGTVTSAKGEPMPQRRVTLMSRDGANLVIDTITDHNGKFVFDNLYFKGNMDYSVQSFDSKGSNEVTISVDKAPSYPIVKKGNTVRIDNAALLSYLNNSNKRFSQLKKYGLLGDKGKTLQEVIVNGKKNSRLEEAVAPSMNLNGPGKADQVITYEDLRNCGDLGMCLQGKLPGVTFKYIFDSANRRRDIIPYSTRGYDRPMLILFDGIEMNSKMGGLTLSTIAPSTIQSIEVLRSGPYLASYGTQAAGGVIIITSKRGGIDYDPVKVQDKNGKLKGIVYSSAKGYSQIREFYSPVYQNTKPNKGIPDLRSTIFWKPDIIIDEDGKAVTSFYAADTPGIYRVVVEGIADNGRPGRQVFTINVQ